MEEDINIKFTQEQINFIKECLADRIKLCVDIQKWSDKVGFENSLNRAKWNLAVKILNKFENV